MQHNRKEKAVKINNRWKRQCLLLGAEEFEGLIKEIYPGMQPICHYDLDGLWVASDTDDDFGPTDREFCQDVGKHLGINVTSIHIDDCDLPGVWICYTEAAMS